MTEASVVLRPSDPAQDGQARWLADVLETLDATVVSAEPAVVFSSVAWLCVPLMGDAVTIAITEANRATYGIRWPGPNATVDDPALYPRHTISAAFQSPSTDHDAGYSGVLALHFHGSRPEATHAVLPQLIVERCVDIIERERLAETVRAQQQRAENLEVGLHSSREIGIAMGIVMGSRKVTSQAAFELLSKVSQHSQRKIRDIAVDVGHTGTLDLPRSLVGPVVVAL
jgi:hypothetical protein